VTDHLFGIRVASPVARYLGNDPDTLHDSDVKRDRSQCAREMHLNPSAARLAEWLDETLTVH